MRTPTLLLPEKQFHRAMIRAQHILMDGHLPDSGQEGFGNEEIVQPPADAAFTRAHAIGPPGILDSLRVKMAVHVHKALVEELLNPGALLRQETGRPYIL